MLMLRLGCGEPRQPYDHDDGLTITLTFTKRSICCARAECQTHQLMQPSVSASGIVEKMHPDRLCRVVLCDGDECGHRSRSRIPQNHIG